MALSTDNLQLVIDDFLCRSAAKPIRLGESLRRARLLHRSLPLFLALCVILVATGCSSLIDPNVPERIVELQEPETGAAYLLYRPSSYNSNSKWPLVIVCHSSFGDSPNRQIKEWTLLAESNGFIVAAPQLEHDRNYNPLDEDDPAATQNLDERRILSTVRHVQAGQNVSEDRILLYGYSRGAEPALYTGLRNPEVFRAIGLVSPDVDPARLPARRADPNQAVYVRAKLSELLKLPEAIKKDATAALLAWLASNEVNATLDRAANVSREDAALATEFFELVLRREPWLHISAFTPDPQKPLTLQFKARASFVPQRYDWRFPNRLTYNEASPIYTFDAPGEYAVMLAVPSPIDAKRPTEITRAVVVRVPGGQSYPQPR